MDFHGDGLICHLDPSIIGWLRYCFQAIRRYRRLATASPQNKSANSATNDTQAATGGNTDTEEHGHKDGQHGGIIVSLGRDSYHIEAVVASDGQIRLFTLGKDETRVIDDVESQTLKGFAKAEGDPQAQELSFEPFTARWRRCQSYVSLHWQTPETLIGKIPRRYYSQHSH